MESLFEQIGGLADMGLVAAKESPYAMTGNAYCIEGLTADGRKYVEDILNAMTEEKSSKKHIIKYVKRIAKFAQKVCDAADQVSSNPVSAILKILLLSIDVLEKHIDEK